MNLVDAKKRYICRCWHLNNEIMKRKNTHLLEAGVDILICNSSEGFSNGQARTIA